MFFIIGGNQTTPAIILSVILSYVLITGLAVLAIWFFSFLLTVFTLPAVIVGSAFALALTASYYRFVAP